MVLEEPEAKFWRALGRAGEADPTPPPPYLRILSGQLSKLGSLLGPFFIGVLYDLGGLKSDPTLENYP